MLARMIDQTISPSETKFPNSREKCGLSQTKFFGQPMVCRATTLGKEFFPILHFIA